MKLFFAFRWESDWTRRTRTGGVRTQLFQYLQAQLDLLIVAAHWLESLCRTSSAPGRSWPISTEGFSWQQEFSPPLENLQKVEDLALCLQPPGVGRRQKHSSSEAHVFSHGEFPPWLAAYYRRQNLERSGIEARLCVEGLKSPTPLTPGGRTLRSSGVFVNTLIPEQQKASEWGRETTSMIEFPAKSLFYFFFWYTPFSTHFSSSLSSQRHG